MSDAIKIRRLEAAISYLKYARYQVVLALGTTDSGEETVADIDGIIEDIDADIVFFQNGSPRDPAA